LSFFGHDFLTPILILALLERLFSCNSSSLGVIALDGLQSKGWFYIKSGF
jgi:hypothetical protein